MKPKKSAQEAVDYLTGSHTSEGELRAMDPTVLDGNIDDFLRITNSTNRKHTYQSGYLSFSEILSEEEKIKAIEEFKKFAFAGLKQHENYEAVFIEHHDHERTEIHFLIAATEIETGLRLNVAPPGWQYFYEDWQLLMNLENGWSRPDIPVNVENINKYENVDRTKIKDVVREIAVDLAQRELISNRDDLIKELSKINGLTITKTTKTGITYEYDNETFRQKGGIFDSRKCESIIAEIKGEERDFTCDIDEVRERVAEKRAQVMRKNDKEYLQRIRKENGKDAESVSSRNVSESDISEPDAFEQAADLYSTSNNNRSDDAPSLLSNHRTTKRTELNIPKSWGETYERIREAAANYSERWKEGIHKLRELASGLRKSTADSDRKYAESDRRISENLERSAANNRKNDAALDAIGEGIKNLKLEKENQRVAEQERRAREKREEWQRDFDRRARELEGDSPSPTPR